MHFKKLIILLLFIPINSFSQLLSLSDLIQLRNATFNETQKCFAYKKFTLEYKVSSADSTKEIVSFRSTDKIFQSVRLVYDSTCEKCIFLTLLCEFDQFRLLKDEIEARHFDNISNHVKLTDADVFTKKLYVYQGREFIFEFKIFGAPPETNMFSVTICDISDYKKL